MVPRLSAHLGYLFTDLPLEARFTAARAGGFDAVEHPAPFAIPAVRLRALLEDEGLRLAQITSGSGGPGEKGIASLPGREAEFADAYARALDYAEAVACPFVHPMAGTHGDAATYRRNLDTALRLAEGRRPRVLVEAISEAAVPFYHLAHTDALLVLAAELPDLRLLVDSFHTQACARDPTAVLRAAGPMLGHVHIADFPGRHQPGTGQIDFAILRAILADMGYAGAIGFEYLPDGPNHLDWLPEWRRAFHDGTD